MSIFKVLIAILVLASLGAAPTATALSLMLAGFLAVLSLVYLRVTRSWSTS